MNPPAIEVIRTQSGRSRSDIAEDQIRKLQKRMVFGGSRPDAAIRACGAGEAVRGRSTVRTGSSDRSGSGISACPDTLSPSIHLATHRFVTVAEVSQQSSPFSCVIAADADMPASTHGRVAKAACAKSMEPTSKVLSRMAMVRESRIAAGL